MTEQNMKIKKVKYMAAQDKIKIEYRSIKNDIEDELSGVFNDKATPEFYNALKDLNKTALAICELPESIVDRVEVYGVTYNYSKDCTMGAMLHCKLALLNSEQEIVFNTPMRKCKTDDEAEGNFLTDIAVDKLWTLELEARKYLSGKRAQISLFGENGETVDADEEINIPSTVKQIKNKKDDTTSFAG